MAPVAIDPVITDTIQPKKDTLGTPPASLARLQKSGIDLSHGYPYRPAKPLYVQDVQKIRSKPREYNDPGRRADPNKASLFSAAKEVTHLTSHIGTEIVGLQLKDLTDVQKDELGLLIAERSVVFFRDQDISPQQQKALGEWYGEVEVHVGTRLCTTLSSIRFSINFTHMSLPIASSSPSPLCTRLFCDLACLTSHRKSLCSFLPQPRWCIPLAF